METTLRTLGLAEAKVVLSFRQQDGMLSKRATSSAFLFQSRPVAKSFATWSGRDGSPGSVADVTCCCHPSGGPNNRRKQSARRSICGSRRSYIGWWSAAAFHGFTTQKPATVFVAVKRQTPARTIEGAEIRFVSVEPRKFFGSKRYPVYGRNILISDPEKTVTDCIDRPDLAGGPAELTRIVHAAMAKIDLINWFSRRSR